MISERPPILMESRSARIGRRKFRTRHFGYAVLMATLAFFCLDHSTRGVDCVETWFTEKRPVAFVFFILFWAGTVLHTVEFIAGRSVKGAGGLREAGADWKPVALYSALGSVVAWLLWAMIFL